MTEAPRAAIWQRRAPSIAAAVAFCVYLPSLGGGFLFDDQHVIVDNRHIRDLRDLGTVLRFQPSRPLLNLTWALNYAASGLSPWSYHLVNVAIHAGNAALLASLFLWMGVRSGGRRDPQAAALVGACLFAASPMAAETVAYVSSRSSALAALFALASLRVAADVLERFSSLRLAGALGLYVLALATKEEALTLPLLLLLLDLFFVAGETPRDLLRRYRIHLPFLLLPPLGLAARRAVTGAWLPPPALDYDRWLTTQAATFPLYVLRALVPVDPAFYRGHPASTWPPGALSLIGIFVTVALAVFAILGRRRWSDASLALAWMAAGLLPSSSLVPLKEMVVDHRAYLGSAGIAYFAGGWIWRRGRAPVVAGLIAVLAALAIRYERVLADPARAWHDAVARAPRSAEAHFALGEAYAAGGDLRAEAEFRAAVSLDPTDARAWTNLGSFYVEAGRLADAEWAMRGATRAAPLDSRIRNNLALILLALDREDEAMTELQAAVSGSPPLAQPRIDLAAILIRRGQFDPARRLLEEASGMVLDPADDDRLVSLQQQLP